MSTLKGNVVVGRATGAVELDATTVRGDVRLTANRGGVVVNDNRISGNLECSRNVPPPTGSGNVVRGDASGQCRGF